MSSNDQIREDEEFARRLQQEEIRESGISGLVGGTFRRFLSGTSGESGTRRYGGEREPERWRDESEAPFGEFPDFVGHNPLDELFHALDQMGGSGRFPAQLRRDDLMFGSGESRSGWTPSSFPPMRGRRLSEGRGRSGGSGDERSNAGRGGNRDGSDRNERRREGRDHGERTSGTNNPSRINNPRRLFANGMFQLLSLSNLLMSHGSEPHGFTFHIGTDLGDTATYEEWLELIDRAGSVRQGATPEQINNLPTRVIRDEDQSCPICLSDFKKDEEVRTLPCAHFYHKDCIDPWLRINHSCPRCRADIRGDANMSSTRNNNERYTPSTSGRSSSGRRSVSGSDRSSSRRQNSSRSGSLRDPGRRR